MKAFNLYLIILCFLVFSGPALSAEEATDREPVLYAEKVEIPAHYLNSIIVASEVFRKMQPKADLKNYDLWVYKRGDGVCVSFIRGLIVDKGPPISATRRGGPDAGRGMTFMINHETGEVISALYMR
jgi:hypothetical protein